MIPLAVEVPGEWIASAGAGLVAAGSVVGAIVRHLYTELRDARALLVTRTDAHAKELSHTQDVTLAEVKAASAREATSRAEFSNALDDVGDAVRDVGALVKDLVDLDQKVHDAVTELAAEVRRRSKGEKR